MFLNINSFQKFLLLFFFSVIAFSAYIKINAQNGRDEKPKNLKVLPESISEKDIRSIMQGFTTALGVRCNYCHDDSKGSSFNQIDFASDSKPAKQVARVMIKMVKSVNQDLLKDARNINSNLGEAACITCHRGSPSIKMLEDVLFTEYQKNGFDSAFKKYDELKKKYYGGFTYDFQDHSLLSFASKVFDAGKPEDALLIVKKNCELFPESSTSFTFLGDFYSKKGDTPQAITCFEKALQMDPNNRFAAQQLKKLKPDTNK
jgi:tetratricopeptide (TPR) repeat protein